MVIEGWPLDVVGVAHAFESTERFLVEGLADVEGVCLIERRALLGLNLYRCHPSLLFEFINHLKSRHTDLGLTEIIVIDS